MRETMAASEKKQSTPAGRAPGGTALTMLGTGNAMVTRCYNTCFTLRSSEGVLLVDAGGGNEIFSRLERAGVAFSEIRGMFLTHTHTDHVLGAVWVLRKIMTMIKSGKYEGNFRVFCHREAAETLKSICLLTLQEKFTALFDSRVLLETLEDGDTVTCAGMTVTAFDIHSTKLKQFGFTLRTPEGKKLVCLGDEPFNPACGGDIREADLLMSEAFCLYEDRERFKPYEKHHSTALDAGRVAKELGAKRLLLYHTEDETLLSRKARYTSEAKGVFPGEVLVPEDLETVTL